jgi:hypothetical protein
MGYKKCPPGVICVENITMVFIVIFVFIIGYFIYTNIVKGVSNKSKTTIINQNINKPSADYNGNGYPGIGISGGFGYDVLLNPYVPPFRDERAGYVMPVNISTNIGATPANTNYRQVGILTPLSNHKQTEGHRDKLLPLMGRPVNTSRDYWQYYTMSDQNNSIKLPILKNGKSCTNEYGCPKIYDGDNVVVEGYNAIFRTTLYDTDTIKYISYL